MLDGSRESVSFMGLECTTSEGQRSTANTANRCTPTRYSMPMSTPCAHDVRFLRIVDTSCAVESA